MLRLLSAVKAAVELPEGQRLLLRSIGYCDVVAARVDLAALISALGDAVDSIASLDAMQLDDWQGVAELLDTIGATSSAIAALGNTDVAGLGRELADSLVVTYLRARFPRLFRVACLLDLIEPGESAPAAPLQCGQSRHPGG